MIGDPNLAWLVKKAMGGEAYNKLFEHDAWRAEMHAAKTKQPNPRPIDRSLLATPPFEPPHPPPEEGWPFWYPETVPNPEKREQKIRERVEAERVARETGAPLQPPRDYVYPEGAEYSPRDEL